MEKEIIIRYTAPTRYDKAPYGTICKVIIEGEKHKLYIQVSPDDVENSEWVRWGDFLEVVFKRDIFEKAFVKDCLDLYPAK
jgi:isopentenyldiphosphate isomerase